MTNRKVLETQIDANYLAFGRFIRFFCELFQQPGLLEGVDCRASYKEYVPKYYRDTFGPGVEPLTTRHIKWFRRLEPIFALPRGSTILDYGGGYGMDSVFLASIGYQVVFYEITSHHIAIATRFAEQFGKQFGSLPISFVLAGASPEPRGLDAVLLNEVAHHIEPVQRVFSSAARMLRRDGDLFLMEPNYLCPATQAFFFKVRGFRTVEWRTNELTGQRYLYGNENIRPVFAWNRHAAAEGFKLKDARYVVPWFMARSHHKPSAVRRTMERLPLLRHLLGSHVTINYQRT